MDGYRSRFVISATAAADMAAAAGVSLLSLLPTLVRSSQPLARPLISNYHVAAVGLGSDDRIFVGVNLEFLGAPLHHSVHAEQFLVTSLAAHNGGRLIALAVSAAPCGHCRQFLQELRGAAELQICITDSASPTEFRPLISILPSPFGPFDLLDTRSPLLLEPNHNRLSLMVGGTNREKSMCSTSGKPNHWQASMGEGVSGATSNYDESVRLTCNSENGSVTPDASIADIQLGTRKQVAGPTSNSKERPFVWPSSNSEDGSVVTVGNIAGDVRLSVGKLAAGSKSNSGHGSDVIAASTIDTAGFCNGHCDPSYSQLEIGALEAANKSHAPYSNCPSGVSLMDCEGKIYKGSYVESAAYNPSLGPVQAAVVAYVAAGGGGYERIVAGVLVEKEGAVVSQEDTARLLLKLIAPKCELRVIHCRSD